MTEDALKEKKHGTVPLIATAILSSFAVTAFVFCLYFAVSYFRAVLQAPSVQGTQDSLSVGLSMAFSVVFMLLFAAGGSLFSLPAILTARAARRRCEGKLRSLAHGILITNTVACSLTVALTAFVYFAARFDWI